MLYKEYCEKIGIPYKTDETKIDKPDVKQPEGAQSNPKEIKLTLNPNAPNLTPKTLEPTRGRPPKEKTETE